MIASKQRYGLRRSEVGGAVDGLCVVRLVGALTALWGSSGFHALTMHRIAVDPRSPLKGLVLLPRRRVIDPAFPLTPSS